MDVAREYAAQAGLTSIPLIHTALGTLVPAAAALVDAGVEPGDVLVASTSVHRAAGSAETAVAREEPAARGVVPVLVVCLAAGAAALAGWYAARSGSAGQHDLAVGVLVAGALVGVLPFGSHRRSRALAAPAFAAAAAFAMLGQTASERLPLALGICAMAAAVTAAVTRALDESVDAAARVWMVAGGGVFALTALAALADQPPRVLWSVLLVLAMLAARIVPTVAVDVPDSFLIDLDRLAITAWSARELPRSRRGRVVVPEAAVVAVAARGTELVTATAAAVLVVTGFAAPLVLATATLPVDRIGARVLVLVCGAALVLAGRSYRHAAAREMLRAAGVACWVALTASLVTVLSGSEWLAAGVGATSAALVLVLVAVGTGRGWRSAWWSRRAELAEALCGSSAIAAMVVAAGFFRVLWETTS